MNVEFNSAGLEQLVKDLEGAAKVTPVLRRIVKRGAVNIKTDARQLFTQQRSGKLLPHYARSIGFDLSDGGLTATIGPDSSMPQGGMGAAIEYGTARGKPMPHLIPALDLEEDGFVEQVTIAGRDAIQ